MCGLRILRQTLIDQKSGCDQSERIYILDCLRPILRTPTLCHTATVVTLEEKAVALTETLRDCRISQCHDARDRIYGLLGLMTAMFGPGFMEVNYKDDPADVYTDYCGKLVAHTGSLMVLSQADYTCNSTLGLPTYVPDWSSAFSHLESHRNRTCYMAYRAAGSYSQSKRHLASANFVPRKLRCMGHVFGTISSTHKSWWNGTDVMKLKNIITKWRDFFPGDDSAFVRTITGFGQGNLSNLGMCYNDIETPNSKRTERQRGVVNDICLSTDNRRFFLTNAAMPGLGPMTVRLGDVLVILAGGRVPYVTTEKQQQYLGESK